MRKYYGGNLIILSFNDLDNKYDQIVKEFIKLSPKYSFFKDIPNPQRHEMLRLPDGHPSAKGHTVIAEALLQYFINGELLPCKLK